MCWTLPDRLTAADAGAHHHSASWLHGSAGGPWKWSARTHDVGDGTAASAARWVTFRNR